MTDVRRPYDRRPYDAIAWWERRRISFNAILLVTGACSVGIIEGVGALLVRPGDDVVEPLALIAGVIVFAIAANACYTLGWITELLWSRGDTARTEGIRPTIYRRGLLLSVAVAAAPGILIPLAWLLFGVR
jgi:hypothetical protein